jgi:tetratricopeptide (TPR) repeat protein
MLGRAIDLDPELAFPYVWLTYANFRRQKFNAGIQAGRKAIELEPLNYQAHYFLATAYIGQAVMEHRLDSFASGEDALRACINLEGNYQPARMILAWLLAIRGDYGEAESQARLAAGIEESMNFEATNFIGGFSLLGNILFRSGRLDQAEQAHRRSLELMTPRSHLYKEQFTAITYCCLGDIALARRRADEALGNFKSALEHIASNPKGLGIGHCMVRAHAGIARTFHKLGMSREARQEFEFALSTLTNRTGHDFSWMWEGSDVESWCELARAAAVMSRYSDALAYLRNAVRGGWCDRVAAQHDECMSRLSGQDGFTELFQQLPHQ